MGVHVIDVEEALIPVAVCVNVAFLQLPLTDQDVFRESAGRKNSKRQSTFPKRCHGESMRVHCCFEREMGVSCHRPRGWSSYFVLNLVLQVPRNEIPGHPSGCSNVLGGYPGTCPFGLYRGRPSIYVFLASRRCSEWLIAVALHARLENLGTWHAEKPYTSQT
jgi:hypothetical protein